MYSHLLAMCGWIVTNTKTKSIHAKQHANETRPCKLNINIHHWTVQMKTNCRHKQVCYTLYLAKAGKYSLHAALLAANLEISISKQHFRVLKPHKLR